MSRTPEQQRFLNITSGRLEDDQPKDQETVATKEELEWWMKHQLFRARRHAQAGEATRTELIYLANQGYYYPTTPKEYRRKPLPKETD